MSEMVSPADLFLSPDLGEEEAQAYLRTRGFRDPAATDRHLRAMADDPAVRQALGGLAGPLLDAVSLTPDPDQAVVGLSRYLAARTASLLFLQYIRDDPPALRLLVEIFGTSPYLTDILVRNPEYFHWARAEIERRRPSSPTDEHNDAGEAPTSSRALLNALKRLKRRHMLGIAARDLLGIDDLPAVARHLSRLAAGVVTRALAIVVHERLIDEGRDAPPGAFTVIGMGKLGGAELNYSSDIDLLYVYDPASDDRQADHEFFHRLARRLTAALADHTEEGYCYRVDLRLRPMGRAGAIAHSLEQLRHYYETIGETFERFALIKAQPVAGDSRLGERFVDLVQPFVYRKYLDHAALEELYQYKARADRRIETTARDRNVKLGWGGIREVELFTQVLQLTYGSRYSDLRQANTLAALEALTASGLIPGEVRDRLASAYAFLRTVEHRLQVVHEAQTHELAEDEDELLRCARRLRFDSVQALRAALDSHRQRVHDVYRGLFERQAGSQGHEAREIFRILGEAEPNAEAIQFLTERGVRAPGEVLEAVRALAQESGAGNLSSRARNTLANLLAASLPRLARSGRPSTMLVRLGRLSAVSGGIAELGRSLLENGVVRDRLLDLLDSGELAAEQLIRRPELLDSLMQPAMSPADRSLRFDASLDDMDALDRVERMDRMRRFVQNESFKIVVEWLASASLDNLQDNLSLLAERSAARAAAWHVPQSRRRLAPSWAVVALGKLGGAEMSVQSDLDLVFVFDDPGDPQDTALGWQRFVEGTQDFLARPTPEGIAYRIDTRLRPEGSKGPLAIPITAFLRYLDERAEPWERLAWTRARVIAGAGDLGDRISTAVEAFVYGPWDARLPGYMRHVRERMETELGGGRSSSLDFKTGKGGLADIDFLLQLVQIREGRRRTEFRVRGSRQFLHACPRTSYLQPDEAERLRAAHGGLRALEMFARMDADASISRIPDDAGALTPIAIRMGLSSGARLLSWYRETTDHVRLMFISVLERLAL